MSTTEVANIATLFVMTDNDHSTFGAWLANELNIRGWTQADLHHETGLSRAAISYYINDQRTPNREAIEKLAAVLKYPPETLFRIAGVIPSYGDAARTAREERLIELINYVTNDDLDELIVLTQHKADRRKRGEIRGEEQGTPG